MAINGDVTVMASMTSAVQEAKAHFGKSPWGLVNCAGIMHYQYVADVDVEVLCSFIYFFKKKSQFCFPLLNCAAVMHYQYVADVDVEAHRICSL